MSVHNVSWRRRAADEFHNQQGSGCKVWWLARFALAVVTLGQVNFGIGALGDPDAKARLAMRRAGVHTAEVGHRHGDAGESTTHE